MGFKVPTQVPYFLISGDTWEWERDLSEYPASEGYTLKYNLNRKSSAGSLIQISSVPDGDTHHVTVDSNDTGAYTTGKYQYVEYVESGTGEDVEKRTVHIGETEILANPTTSTDIRTVNQKILDAIDAMVLGKATKDQKSYTIKNRTLERYSIEELMPLRSYYATLAEKDKDKLEELFGKTSKGIYGKFTKPS